MASKNLRPLIVICFGIVGGVLAAKIYTWLTKPRSFTTESVIQNAPTPTSGSFLKIGRVNDLRFRVIDLGIADSIQVSEAGDLVFMSFGMQPIVSDAVDKDGFPRKRLGLPKGKLVYRSHIGTQSDIRGYFLRMTPDGSVLTKDDPNSSNAYKDGVPILQKMPREFLNGYPNPLSPGSNQTGYGVDGIYLFDPFKSKLVFLDWSGEPKDVRPTKAFSMVYGCSTELGCVTSNSGVEGSQLTLAKKDKATDIQTGDSMFAFPAVVCRDSVYIRRFSKDSNRVSYRKLVGKEFVDLPLPEGCPTVNIEIAGSSKFCIQSAWFGNSQKDGVSGTMKHFYVEDATGYDLLPILRRLEVVDAGHPTYKVLQMSADGDIVVESTIDSYKRLYLLERQS